MKPYLGENPSKKELGCLLGGLVTVLVCAALPNDHEERLRAVFNAEKLQTSKVRQVRGLEVVQGYTYAFTFDYDGDGKPEEAIIYHGPGRDGAEPGIIDVINAVISGKNNIDHYVAGGIPKEKQIFVVDFTKKWSDESRSNIAYVHSFLERKTK